MCFFFLTTVRPFPIVLGNFWATFGVWKLFAVLAKILAKIKFPAIFLTDVSNYCEERKIKLLINAYIKISRNLGGNFLDFLAFFKQLSSILRAQSGKAYWRPIGLTIHSKLFEKTLNHLLRVVKVFNTISLLYMFLTEKDCYLTSNFCKNRSKLKCDRPCYLFIAPWKSTRNSMNNNGPGWQKLFTHRSCSPRGAVGREVGALNYSPDS